MLSVWHLHLQKMQVACRREFNRRLSGLCQWMQFNEVATETSAGHYSAFRNRRRPINWRWV